MSHTCSKCNKVVKAFQRLLVYEPVKEPCKVCERPRPYPGAPPFGTSIKVCSFGEMERMCFPKLCDCPCREIPLCPDALRRERICRAIYWFATFALFAFLFDSGIFRHPVHTTRLSNSLREMIDEFYEKEEAKEGKDEKGKEKKDEKGKEGKDAKGQDGKDAKEGKSGEAKEGEMDKGEKQKDPKREYDKATKIYNMANVWNAAIIGFGDFLILVIKLPKFVLFKTMEAIKGMDEDEAKNDDKVKDLKHEKKGEAKKEEPKKEEEKKQEAKKEEPKKAEQKKKEAKKEEPKKVEQKKQEAKKDEPKKTEQTKQEAEKDKQHEAEDEKQEAKS